MRICFCTLAVHAPYRRRARLLCGDALTFPWVVLTDEPGDFVDLSVRAVAHVPTGPMAIDYLRRLATEGKHRGAPAYHDKRFAVRLALEESDTAIFLDADTRISAAPSLADPKAGLAVLPVVRNTIAGHLETWGSARLPVFAELARDLMGDSDSLFTAKWCHEACFAVTKDGNEDRFFWAWDRAAEALQSQGIFSGEGGAMGLAAAYAGWNVDYDVLAPLAALIRHEGGGPKKA